MTNSKSKSIEPEKTALADNDTLNIKLEDTESITPAVVVVSGHPLAKTFYLSNEVNILGRELNSNISIGETAISRKHAEFKVTPDGVYIKDLGSTNGTFVNDQKVTEPRLLKDGDYIKCGNTILKFVKKKIEKIFHDQVYDAKSTDKATGALNKQTISDIIKEEFERTKIVGSSLSLLMIDIDHFKKVNDTYGHLAGDYVLKESCELIKDKLIRQHDALGRYGGEEFILLLRQTPLKLAVDIAERIRTTIEKHRYKFENRDIPITISIGVATLDSTCQGPEDLISMSDKALYDAKNSGRNRVCIR